MASLYLTEYGGTGNVYAQIAQGPSLGTQKLVVGAETKSTAFKTNTHIIRVHTDSICSILISDPDVNGNYSAATTSSKRMAADQTEYWGVNPGGKLSVIANT